VNRLSTAIGVLSLISINSASAQSTQTERSAAINIVSPATTTTQLVASLGSTLIYVRAWNVLANSAGVFTLEYGTTTNKPCDTGTMALTGAYNFAAQSGMSSSGGLLPLFIIPQGNALCVASGANASFAGSLSYTQD
jgi:hypothetical protein